MPIMVARPRSASSSTMVADLPPSSRKTRFMVAAPFSMMRWPTTVEPVNEIMSTLGESVSCSPIRWSDDVTMLSTPAGMSVFSATTRPRSVAFHGVSGAGLRTTVFPVARDCPSLCEVTSKGKFHGTMAPTTPTGSRQMRRESSEPCRLMASGSTVSHSKASISLAGQAKASEIGASSCGPFVVMRGHPTSRMSCSRSSSCSACSASCSCWRQRLRKAWLVDQSVSSKARRAASMARCISAFEASATRPMTSSVAGFTFSKVRPESASTSLPSSSILCSGLTFTASLTGPSSRRPVHPGHDGGRGRQRHAMSLTRAWEASSRRVSDFDVAVKNYGRIPLSGRQQGPWCHSGGPPTPRGESRPRCSPFPRSSTR